MYLANAPSGPVWKDNIEMEFSLMKIDVALWNGLN
jgi:hypothetical protein